MHQNSQNMSWEMWYNQHTVLFWIAVAYIVVSAFMVLGFIRRPLIRWYRSQSWFLYGDGVIDILFKQIGNRLAVEVFAFLIACIIGSIGGNVIALLVPRRQRSLEEA